MQASTDPKTRSVTFLIVGGGIAGVSCAETLAVYCPGESIMLITESSVIKTIANLEPVARYLYKFDVHEYTLEENSTDKGLTPSILTIVDQLKHIDVSEHQVFTCNHVITYKYLCICTGASPHLICTDNPKVIGIRDTDSVLSLQRRLHKAKRVMLLGNGGIASELAFNLQNIEVHWVVKDKHIAATFVDAGAAHFFQESLCKKAEKNNEVAEESSSVVKRLRYTEILATGDDSKCQHGAALGPDWHRTFSLFGDAADSSTRQPIVHYKTQVDEIKLNSDLLQVKLTNGDMIECDFMVSATGVEPRHDFSCTVPLKLCADGGIAVNEMMETNADDIYAAGDACTPTWEHGKHWFQMRLWTQARQMGAMAGRSMAAKFCGERIYQDFCFELFGHVTELFGYSVILLGRYNGQGLGTNYEILLRSTPGKEYIKFVLQDGHLRGAILIGCTELAETCENLILNEIDLTPFGDDILNPDIDIEDYFD